VACRPQVHDAAANKKTDKERNVEGETGRLMIKPARGLWHFCYSE
jgi:hypothetical protein